MSWTLGQDDDGSTKGPWRTGRSWDWLCEQTDYFVSRAQVTFIKSDSALVYAACPQEGCNKKVTEEGPHMFRCEKCGKVYDRCNFRYNLSVQISDFTSSMWVSMFNDEAEAVFNEKADQLIAWRQQVRACSAAAAHLSVDAS